MKSKINIAEFNEMVNELKGKIFSVDFVKKDGTPRHIVCRRGVTKYVTGAGMSYDPASKGLLCVFDMLKKEYRMVNLNTVERCQIKGRQYLVINGTKQEKSPVS